VIEVIDWHSPLSGKYLCILWSNLYLFAATVLYLKSGTLVRNEIQEKQVKAM